MEKNSESIALALAQKLKMALHRGKVRFSFRKDNGEERHAYGTLKFSDIPEDKHPKGTGGTSPDVIAFFDLEKEAWRSCRATSIINIETDENV